MMLYQDVRIEEIKKEYEQADYTAWLNGAYVLRAIQTAISPKKVKYFEQPFSYEGEREELSEEEKFLLWVEEFNHRFHSK